jgi:outer membrane murein-binding lipoprotein Lpp
MKKIILVSCYIVASVIMASCTSEEVVKKVNTKQQELELVAIDGSTGQIPIKPPKK